MRSWKVVMKLRPVRCFMRYTGQSKVPVFFTSLACGHTPCQRRNSSLWLHHSSELGTSCLKSFVVVGKVGHLTTLAD